MGTIDTWRIALAVTILVGVFVSIGMIWHLWQIAIVHHERANFELERLNSKLDAIIHKVADAGK